MPLVPDALLYSEEHLWVAWTDDEATIGITDYAQLELGPAHFVELPMLEEKFARLDVFGTIEAVTLVSELFSPIGGEVISLNPRLEMEPTLLNTDPYGEGWLVKLRPASMAERDELLGAAEYREQTGEG